MKSHSNFIIIGFFIALAVFAILFFDKQAFISKLNEYKLLPQEEPFTELYFEDHLNLPKTYQEDKKNEFTFTVHNLEYKPFKYDYQIEAIATDSSRILTQGSFNLEHDAYKSITDKIASAEAQGKTKINVSLTNKKQSIHFWLNNPTN